MNLISMRIEKIVSFCFFFENLKESGIDWSCIDTVPELLDPALSSNGNHPNSIPDALREAALNGSTSPSSISFSFVYLFSFHFDFS